MPQTTTGQVFYLLAVSSPSLFRDVTPPTTISLSAEAQWLALYPTLRRMGRPLDPTFPIVAQELPLSDEDDFERKGLLIIFQTLSLETGISAWKFSEKTSCGQGKSFYSFSISRNTQQITVRPARVYSLIIIIHKKYLKERSFLRMSSVKRSGGRTSKDCEWKLVFFRLPRDVSLFGLQ